MGVTTRGRTRWGVGGLILLSIGGLPLAGAAELTEGARVRALESIERVSWSHTVGVPAPFQQAVPRAVIEAKIRETARRSAAIEALWNTQVDHPSLRREVERMIAASQMPERLFETFAALGDDPVLIEECLARPILVERLSRNFLASDERIQAPARRELDAIRAALMAGEIGASRGHPRRRVIELKRAVPDSPPSGASGPALMRPSLEPESTEAQTLDPDAFDEVRARLLLDASGIGPASESAGAFSVSVLLDARTDRMEVAIYEVPKLDFETWWRQAAPPIAVPPLLTVAEDDPSLRGTIADKRASLAGARGDGTASCLPDDTWQNGTWDDVPLGRSGHTSVWTGGVVIIWGGTGPNAARMVGARYDPAIDSWSSLSSVGAPAMRAGASALWTGSKVIIWGGSASGSPTYPTAGGLYDPVSDTWTTTTSVGAPTGRTSHSAVWTGSQMIVWGGSGGTAVNTGGRYDPVADVWSPVTLTGAPTARTDHTAVWTGTQMIVWGGRPPSSPFYTATGGRYDPASDTWTTMSTTAAPLARRDHSAVWTGLVMVVWSGDAQGSLHTATGGRYEPVSDTWQAVSQTGVPPGRTNHSAFWTGTRMVVWGGNGPSSNGNTGGRYDPVADSWSPTSLVNATSARHDNSAVWTGQLMIVWGGVDNTIGITNTGGRYDPVADSWTPMSTGGGPPARTLHGAVWTGTRMLIWGGMPPAGPLTSGSGYDPMTDSWSAMSMVNAPMDRTYFSTVWTGTEMIVWGGDSGLTTKIDSGGRYNPVSNTWTATTLVGAPAGRVLHVGVWTGTRMLVWGGSTAALPNGTDTGASYDPSTDAWQPITTTGAPSARRFHTGVWTGSRMIVWGGNDGFGFLNTGGSYDPATSTWTATSTLAAPIARGSHSAVWTGQMMIVWGGEDLGFYYSSGGLYDPAMDEWQPMSFASGPTPRTAHRALWTGARMIVWGGSSSSVLDSGGRYDLASDSWTPTSLTGAPAPRKFHSAVWTGSFMLVWGGWDISLTFNDGGRYVLEQHADIDNDSVSLCMGDCNDFDASTFPGALEACDNLDNDCDGTTDNVLPPAGLPGLFLSEQASGTAHLSWGGVPVATAYDVVRGSLSALSTSYGDFSTATTSCLADNLAAIATDDSAMPPAGSGFWYLLRAVNCAGAGSYESGSLSQIGSRDPEIGASGQDCLP